MDISYDCFRLITQGHRLIISISNSDDGPFIHHFTSSKRPRSIGEKHPHLIDENIKYIKR